MPKKAELLIKNPLDLVRLKPFQWNDHARVGIDNNPLNNSNGCQLTAASDGQIKFATKNWEKIPSNLLPLLLLFLLLMLLLLMLLLLLLLLVLLPSVFFMPGTVSVGLSCCAENRATGFLMMMKTRYRRLLLARTNFLGSATFGRMTFFWREIYVLDIYSLPLPVKEIPQRPKKFTGQSNTQKLLSVNSCIDLLIGYF